MNMQLRTKLLIGFVAVALIGSVIGGVGIYGIKNIVDADTKLYEKITVPMSQLVTITESFQRVRINIRDLNDAPTPEARKVFADKIDELQATFLATAKEFETTILTDSGREQFAGLLKANEAYNLDIDKVVSLVNANKEAEAKALLAGSAKQTAFEVQGKIDSLVEAKNKLAKDTSTSNTELANTMTLIMLITMFGGLAISIALAIWLGVFMVSRPLMKISETLGSGSSQIGTASNQLSSASQEIANGTTEQASSIEETSSSMEELSSMVKQNVANAKEASILADKAAESSQVGFGQMEKMLDSMNEINKSSDKIKKIIKVIDDIAFQTNILALNAAVEAARAGEAGMGFAVVADEVKNLANRSADAAKETADMIEDSLHKTSQGLDIAVKMSEVFKDILTTAKKVSEMAREVESASRQQDTGIEQVNQAIVQFDEVVQTNAASAEETASAAEELQSQVENLNDVVATLLKLVTGKETAKIERVSARQPAERVHKPVHQLTHRPAAAPRKVQGTRTAVPEQMIPFDDDDDLKSL